MTYGGFGSTSYQLNDEQKRKLADALDLVIRFEIMPEQISDKAIADSLAWLDGMHGVKPSPLPNPGEGPRDVLLRFETVAALADRALAVRLVDQLSRALRAFVK